MNFYWNTCYFFRVSFFYFLFVHFVQFKTMNQAPKPVYSAKSFEEMIDWHKEQVCPPPYVQFHTDEEIQQYLVTPLMLDVPSNSQHVERFIQVNAKVGTKAASNRDRNGLVLARQKYQKENPNKENKPGCSKQRLS